MRLDARSQDFREARQHIYGLAHNVCINGVEQANLVSAIRDVEIASLKDGETGQRTIRNMLALIENGLTYGTWPWSEVPKS